MAQSYKNEIQAGAEGRGAEGGQVPPLNFQFFLLISDNDNALN